MEYAKFMKPFEIYSASDSAERRIPADDCTSPMKQLEHIHSIDEDVGKTALPEQFAMIGGFGSEIWLYPDRRSLEERRSS